MWTHVIRDLHKKEKKNVALCGLTWHEVKKIVMRCVGSCDMRFKHKKKERKKSRFAVGLTWHEVKKNRDALCGLMWHEIFCKSWVPDWVVWKMSNGLCLLFISETGGSYEKEGGRHHGGDSTVHIQSAFFFLTLCFVGGVGVIRVKQ